MNPSTRPPSTIPNARISHFGIIVKCLYNRSVPRLKFTAEEERLQVLLREVRLDAGLTQADLAGRLGQAQSFVSKYESGERRLDLLEVRQVCRALGMSLRDFVRRLEESLS